MSDGGLPKAQLCLGLGGLIPFVAGAVLLWLQPPWAGQAWLLGALNGYALAILSFLGGVAWGAGLARGEQGWAVYILAVLPSLVGWAVFLVLPPIWQPLGFAAAFAAVFIVDRGHVTAGRYPLAFLYLRMLLTAVVIAALLIGGWAVMLASPMR